MLSIFILRGTYAHRNLLADSFIAFQVALEWQSNNYSRDKKAPNKIRNQIGKKNNMQVENYFQLCLDIGKVVNDVHLHMEAKLETCETFCYITSLEIVQSLAFGLHQRTVNSTCKLSKLLAINPHYPE